MSISLPLSMYVWMCVYIFNCSSGDTGGGGGTGSGDDGGGMSVTPPQRQTRLAQACMSGIFDLCGDTSIMELELKRFNDLEISGMAYKMMIPKVADILDRYIEDESRCFGRGIRVLARYRQDEVIHILKLMDKLNVGEGLDEMAWGYGDGKKKRKMKMKRVRKKKMMKEMEKERGIEEGGTGMFGYLFGGSVSEQVGIEGGGDGEKEERDPDFESEEDMDVGMDMGAHHVYFNGKLKINKKWNRCSHLFRLHPILSRLIRVNEPKIKIYLCQLFESIGLQMGLG